MRREVFDENADGTPSEVVKERTYDLKSDKQGRMIQSVFRRAFRCAILRTTRK